MSGGISPVARRCAPCLNPVLSNDENKPLWSRLRRLLVGPPRDIGDRSLFHHLSLIPFLAWVGLGADGLSSSCYGPEEAYRTLNEHTWMALVLAGAMVLTILTIAAAYSRIIEQFPHGGGGYVVATKLLGRHAGVVSGCALLVDYMLTITVSISAAGDAMFSLLPADAAPLGVPLASLKLPLEAALIVGLVALNIRGVRESVLVLMPIFILFLVTHAALLVGGVFAHLDELPAVATSVKAGFHGSLGSLGFGGMLLLLIHAYSLGGGTYTGIEAVSNGLPIMREPRVRTAKRTMLYMSASLAFTASGLLLCFLLWRVEPVPNKTLNAVLAGQFARQLPAGHLFVILTLLAEATLLVVAAQAGFLDGPRVLANMAVDSWAPRRFAALSDRLTAQNGILLMGVASLIALFYTRGDVRHLVVMYSINVFLTFSLSMLGMLRWWAARRKHPLWRRRTALFGAGFCLCATILTITALEKFGEGGWITLLVTAGFVGVCFVIHRHYEALARKFERLDHDLRALTTIEPVQAAVPALDPEQPTAAVLVSSFSQFGIHTMLNIHRSFRGHYRNYVFIGVGIIDSGGFKGEGAVDELRASTQGMLEQYVRTAHRMGVPAAFRMGVAIEVVAEAERLCLETAREFSRCTFFSGQLLFQRETWYHRLLHNQTAFALQKRLHWLGHTMVIMPMRVRET